MSRARDIALPCLAAGALFVAFGLLVLLPGGDGGDFAAAAAHAGPAAAVAPLPPLSAPLRLEAGGAAVFAPAYPSRMLDRIAAAIDGVESNYGTNPGMWRADPVGPQGPMQVSAAAARDVGGGAPTGCRLRSSAIPAGSCSPPPLPACRCRSRSCGRCSLRRILPAASRSGPQPRRDGLPPCAAARRACRDGGRSAPSIRATRCSGSTA